MHQNFRVSPGLGVFFSGWRFDDGEIPFIPDLFLKGAAPHMLDFILVPTRPSSSQVQG